MNKNEGLVFIKKVFYCVIIVFNVAFIIILPTKLENNNLSNTNVILDNENISEEETSVSSSDKVNADVFESSNIPDEILQKMIGNSIPEKSKNKVDISNLSYLKITYFGFDNESHIGEMIVNKKLASEVLDIFKEVYEKKYPIEKIRLIDVYGADDELSMQDNNTSAFCYRVVANTSSLSNHSYGNSIDVNPLYNPYISGKIISPNNAKEYVDRTINKIGVIKKGDDLYNAFISRGWTWGGEWKNKKDYQHFEKEV